MAKQQQQRMMRVDQRGQVAALEQLETRSDEELEAETRNKAAAQTILGRRAAERYDAKAARAHFQKARAAARPQERAKITRIADASLALAERRAEDFRAAAERLGGEVPTKGQIRKLKIIGLVAPPASAGVLPRVRGVLLVIAAIVVLLAAGFGIVSLIALPAGGLQLDLRIFYGFALVMVVLGVMSFIGRRKQKAATKAQRDEKPAARQR